MSTADHTFALILAGGGGTRLWPKSRAQAPKQFLKLTSSQTMMQVAADRTNQLVPWERTIVITNQLYLKEVRRQLPQVPEQNIICEPRQRDTALAMLVGAMFAQLKDPQAVIINSAADHVVTNQAEFVKVMQSAAEVATQESWLVSVGITPTYPSTGFGYIQIGAQLSKLGRGLPLFKVDSFTEKPNQATARAFISTGKYFWNANMYVWSAATLMAAFQTHLPEMADLAAELPGLKPRQFHQQLDKIYDQAETIAIDYAISEKADNLVLIPGDFGWDDVGDWQVVYNLSAKDPAGNVVLSDSDTPQTLIVESHNNLVHSNNRLVALVGVDDLVVVDTGEIVMVVPKHRSQDVKKLVQRLKEDGKTEYL
ncbi:MAG: mannose-1-phosphate guanylyltransferase [Candidatus Pacebacteria bacterium CG10_big_fil_rev_8_21_14_0_10_56_10]|nr:MAG: mannose-1-phosphate guanylyltransferase [Candidatus Pacebacteria bacterium CG10_big_fil_rev_8_21_14_0_10_56_10]